MKPTNSFQVNFYIFLFITIIILSIALRLYITFKPAIRKFKRRNKYIDSPTEEFNLDEYKNKYQKQFILSMNEKMNYYTMKSVIDELELHIFAKVRLLDIIEPKSDIKNWKKYFWKIQAKHVDFLICKKNVTTLCVVEIDDNSHNRNDRKERDEFVDYILKDCGIPIIRRKYINKEEFKKTLEKIINKETPAAGGRPALDEGLQSPNDTTEKLNTDRQHSDAKTKGDPGHNIS